jgi:hypothetical protein
MFSPRRNQQSNRDIHDDINTNRSHDDSNPYDNLQQISRLQHLLSYQDASSVPNVYRSPKWKPNQQYDLPYPEMYDSHRHPSNRPTSSDEVDAFLTNWIKQQQSNNHIRNDSDDELRPPLHMKPPRSVFPQAGTNIIRNNPGKLFDGELDLPL